MPLIRVLEIPKGDGNFRFGGGQAQPFVEVDWFRDDNGPSMSDENGRKNLADFIKGKNYFNPAKAYLVLHQAASFTINYQAP